MIKRFAAQLGILILACAWTGGAVFADSGDSTAPAQTASQQSNDATVTQSGSGSVDVQVSHDSSQAVGSPSDSNQPPSANGDGAASSQGSNSTYSSPSDGSDSPAVIATPSQPSVDPAGAIASTPAKAGDTSVLSAIQHAAYQNEYKQIALGTSQLASSAAQPSQPNTPPTPAGLLSQLRALLIAGMVPALQHAEGYTAAIIVPSTVLSLGALLALIAFSLLLLANTYTDRLRRSGHSTAARSDVGATVFQFVTPRKMGFIPVPVT